MLLSNVLGVMVAAPAEDACASPAQRHSRGIGAVVDHGRVGAQGDAEGGEGRRVAVFPGTAGKKPTAYQLVVFV